MTLQRNVLGCEEGWKDEEEGGVIISGVSEVVQSRETTSLHGPLDILQLRSLYKE